MKPIYAPLPLNATRNFIKLNLSLNLSLIIYICLFLSLLASCARPLVRNAQSTDARGNPMLIGACHRSTMQQAPYSEWYEKNYAAYQPDSSATAALQQALRGKSIDIFLGSWCGDSKREVPRMLKLLDAAGVSAKQIRIIFVSNHDSVYKQSPQHEERGLHIFRVPTFIVREKGKEINRIIESPVVSLEKDLLAICSRELYQPNYRGAQLVLTLLAAQPSGNADAARIAEQAKPLVQHAAELNSLGYVLLNGKEPGKALLVFKTNTLLFPQDANIWDSLAEGLLKTGDKAGAAAAYRKVLELQPDNAVAKKALEQLQ